jgi:hypothetical protein
MFDSNSVSVKLMFESHLHTTRYRRNYRQQRSMFPRGKLDKVLHRFLENVRRVCKISKSDY